MIKVLQNWIEIGEATRFLRSRGLPLHESVEKNWDFFQLIKLIEMMDRKIHIIDLGCGALNTLTLLSSMGFENLYGIDLSVNMAARIKQLKLWLGKRLSYKPLRLFKGDLCKTKISDSKFDLAICISTIEHGIELTDFFKEAKRILRRDGILFVTTDYWETKLSIKLRKNPYNLPWVIYSKQEIEKLINVGREHGFQLYKDGNIQDVIDKCVIWGGQEYTFINLIFKNIK